MKRSRRRWLFLALVACGLAWLCIGSVEETRYSPFTLEYQRRRVLEFAVGSIPLYASEWKAAPMELLTYIQQQGIVEPLPNSDPRWELVFRINKGERRGWRRPFHVLESSFVEWSKENPQIAEPTWKIGFTLIRSDSKKEVDAGYELLRDARFYCKKPDDLKKLLRELDAAYEIHALEIEASRLSVFKDEPTKPAMLGLEDKFLFFPDRYPVGDWKPKGLEFEDAFFTSSDGVKLHGWYCPCKDARAVVLHAHGNGGHLAYEAPLLKFYQQRLRVASFIFDYRGYGRSEGTPGVVGILQDARAARTWLTKKTGLKENQIVLRGQSLGGAVAVDLAADGGARGLVLESTFSSLKDAAAHHWGGLAMFASPKKLNSVERIKNYRGPLLMMHGDADDVVPYELGRKLFEAANEPKEWVRIPRGNHGGSLASEFTEKLDAFIESLPR